MSIVFETYKINIVVTIQSTTNQATYL